MPLIHLPFDTAQYDDLPISVMIYEPLTSEDGTLLDYRVVYANKVFIRDWRDIYHNDDWSGALLMQSTLMDDWSFEMMNRFRTEKPRPFSTYMPLVDLHLHFEPMQGLPAPYAGFFMMNIGDYKEQEAKVHFLKNIRQMENTAVLMQRHTDGHLEAVYVSEDFARMMECSLEEAVRKTDGVGFVNMVHPEDRALVRGILKRRASEDGTRELTLQMVTAKGRRLWCTVHFAFIDDFSENYIYCTYHNVTVLKEYEERLRSVYVNIGNRFYQAGEHTLALLRINASRDVVEDLKGTDLYDSDYIGRTWSESMAQRAENYLIPGERARFLELFGCKELASGFLAGRVTVSQMFYSRRRDGRLCFVKLTANVTRHPMTGDVVVFLAEEECNDEKVNAVLQTEILARQFDMVSWLADGRYGVVIGSAANISAGSIFPTSRSGDYGVYLTSQVFPVLHGDEQQRRETEKALSLEAVAEGLRRGMPYVVNVPVKIDGEVWHKRFDFYSVSREAEFYILLKSDVTAIHREQARRNEQLRDALREARQANTAKTAFLSSMSHEIRTPMNAIIGLDNIALRDPELPPRTREHLEKIGGSARHLLGLINDILDMSRIESGRMTLKNEEFSFHAMLEQINTMIGGQCADRGLDYDFRIIGAVRDYYIGDDMKLKQVLINILGNAVKFTPAPGTVSFTVEQTAEYADQSTLRFIIRDTGIGMDRDYLPGIFEAFSQEDATTTNRYGGSGLGMAITKNIVEMMNGDISVDSEKGAGTVFTVNVSLRASERSGADKGAALPPDLRVLVIDDDPVDLESTRVVLEENGISADVCLDGDGACELARLYLARRQSYGLILVDYQLPGEDGVALTRRLRSIVGDSAAILLLTAYDWTDIEEEARAAGVDDFLRKPLFSSEAADEFAAVLSRRAPAGAEERRSADLTGKRILLAEDMLINAEIMRELLEMRDMQVDHAENGRLAVELFSQNPPGHYAAVLMDVRMPVLDGLGATAAIRALDRPDAATVPIIAMTANAFDEDVQRSLQAGMNAHLTKPVEPERLYATLEGLIQDDAGGAL
ncbi:MAG: response regulator [Oscillospiraceae bacterium]|nr:response regulator [Oscillospiraceae bacterium]